MPTLISNGRIDVDDDWQFIDPDSEGLEWLTGSRIVVPADHAIANADVLFANDRAVGVSVPGDAEPDLLEPLLGRVALIAIDFPTFNDGRGLSLAVLLRTRCQFRGELRAIGDVHTDMMHYLHRCGFDSCVLPDGRNPRTALRALASLTDFYQGSVRQPLPAFRRVERGGALSGMLSRHT
jgi:uncharacterized protein (DUF934 family)